MSDSARAATTRSDLASDQLWPPDRPNPGGLLAVALKLVAGAVVLAGLLMLTGVALASSKVGDSRVERWFAHHRTAVLNTLTDAGSHIGSTPGIIVAASITVLALRLWLGRWYESIVVVVAVAGELCIFLAVTATVDRQRPDVPHLDAAPPTSSFPSGHTAASTALYALLAYLALRYARSRGGAIAAVTLCLAVPVVVAVSRLYRGMHFPSDVIGGMACGGLWLAIVLTVLMPPAWTSFRAGRSAPR